MKNEVIAWRVPAVWLSSRPTLIKKRPSRVKSSCMTPRLPTRQHAVLHDARSSLHPPVNAFQLLERLARQRVPHVNFWVLA
jgi:hypothetical protein